MTERRDPSVPNLGVEIPGAQFSSAQFSNSQFSSVPISSGRSWNTASPDDLTWSTPLWALIITAVLPTLAAAVYFSLAGKQQWVALGYGTTKLFTVIWPWIAAWWWRSRNSQSSVNRVQSVSFGTISGMIGMAAIIALYWGPLSSIASMAASQIAAKVELLGIRHHYLAFALFLSFVHSAIEEIYWRWFLFGNLRERISLRPAMLLASLAFAAHHFVILSAFTSGIWIVIGGLLVAAAGCLWCWLYQKTKSLLGSWISHVFLDLAIFWVGFELVRLAS